MGGGGGRGFVKWNLIMSLVSTIILIIFGLKRFYFYNPEAIVFKFIPRPGRNDAKNISTISRWNQHFDNLCQRQGKNLIRNLSI